MQRVTETMICEVEEDLDSVGALDLSRFRPGAGEGFKVTELCEICSDMASGRNGCGPVLAEECRAAITIF